MIVPAGAHPDLHLEAVALNGQPIVKKMARPAGAPTGQA